MSQADVLVVGAGVAGLTTAVCLAESGARVRVVARERPEDTTSTAAGAVWAPYRIGGDPARINRWSQRSLEVFTALARSERSGVQMIVSMEVGHRPVEAPDWAPLLPGVRPCASDELPAGYAHGYRFVIPAIDMPPYLAYLLARLKDAGGTFQQDAVTSLEMVSGSVPAVVNCTGMGARELARDATLRPVRGQLVIIANPGVEIGLVEAEDEEDLTELTFLIPHRSTLVLGARPSLMTSAHILTRTPQGPFLLDASASTAVWRERRSSLNVWDFVPNDQRSGSRASDTGIPGSGTTTVTVGRASPCRGAAPRRSPPMCSQYSAAEFPQRGDNPGT